jgi:hypothetical protein
MSLLLFGAAANLYLSKPASKSSSPAASETNFIEQLEIR